MTNGVRTWRPSALGWERARGWWGSARGRGHLVVVGALEQSRVVTVHLQGRLAGDIRRAASPRPRVRVQELPRVVGAVAQPGTVEAGVRSVDVLGRVSLHEQVDGHHPGALQGRERHGLMLTLLTAAFSTTNTTEQKYKCGVFLLCLQCTRAPEDSHYTTLCPGFLQ